MGLREGLGSRPPISSCNSEQPVLVLCDGAERLYLAVETNLLENFSVGEAEPIR